MTLSSAELLLHALPFYDGGLGTADPHESILALQVD
jgi:hypothetical protein